MSQTVGAQHITGCVPVAPEIPPSCAEPNEVLVLSSGTRLLLRPVCGEDRARVAELFARLTPESRRRRFLSPKLELTPREVAALTDIDHVMHEGIVAVDPTDCSIVGLGQSVRVADRAGVAEVAVVVADESQRMGIGTALTRRAVQHARSNGVTLLTASTLWENRPARALLRALGFRVRSSGDGVIELELQLERPGISPKGHTDIRVAQ